MKKLFQYAVLLHTKNDKGVVTDSKIIIEPKWVLAKDANAVAFIVTREIPEEFTSDPENVEILVKGF